MCECRTIKFRGISLETGAYVYGYLIGYDKIRVYTYGTCCRHAKPTYEDIIVNPSTISQGTNVFDVNDVEIYEGDSIMVNGEQTILISDIREIFEVIHKPSVEKFEVIK